MYMSHYWDVHADKNGEQSGDLILTSLRIYVEAKLQYLASR